MDELGNRLNELENKANELYNRTNEIENTALRVAKDAILFAMDRMLGDIEKNIETMSKEELKNGLYSTLDMNRGLIKMMNDMAEMNEEKMLEKNREN